MSFQKSPKAVPMPSPPPLFEVLTAPRVERIYWDKGTGAHTDISVLGAVLESIPEGAYMMGQIAVPAHADFVPTSKVFLVKPLVEKDDSGDLIKPPTGYEQVWTSSGSGGKEEGSFWRVEAPSGYVALGDVACKGYTGYSHSSPTSQFTAKYACIREDLLSEGEVHPGALWTDRGSGAHMDVSIWNVEGNGLGGFFIANGSYDKPSRKVFVLPARVSKDDQ
ncbi:uncharacterized protein LOC144658339 [Oculina patagonica]